MHDSFQLFFYQNHTVCEFRDMPDIIEIEKNRGFGDCGDILYLSDTFSRLFCQLYNRGRAIYKTFKKCGTIQNSTENDPHNSGLLNLLRHMFFKYLEPH